MTRHTTSVAGTIPARNAHLDARTLPAELHVERSGVFRWDSWLILPSPYGGMGTVRLLPERLTQQRAIEMGLRVIAEYGENHRRPVSYRVVLHKLVKS